jgi:glycosyltransferase involved in cell wall biosynthesis
MTLPRSSLPRVSIGLPVFNGERFVAEALDSLLAQSFADFEIIISDNASTDATEEICRARAHRDARVHYSRLDANLGAAANFNRVFDAARGQYFKWAAHDDLIAPTWLARSVEVLDEDPSAVLCRSCVSTIDENGVLVRHDDRGLPNVSDERAPVRFRDLVLIDHMCNDVFGLIRSSALRRTRRLGGYIASDRVLLAELGLLGRFRTIPEPLFFIREHPGRSVNALPFHQRASWYDPAGSRGPVFPHWRFYGEYIALVGRADLGRSDRRACYGHLCRWPWTNMNWARLVSDVAIAVNPALDRRLTGLGRRLAHPH